MNNKISKHILSSCPYICSEKEYAKKQFFHLEMNSEVGGDLSPLRRLNLYHILSSTIFYQTKGDVVELGCYQGKTTLFMCDILNFFKSNKEIHVFDSFEGVSEILEQDEETPIEKGSFKCSLKEFEKTFKECRTKPIVHKGWFENTLVNLPNKICFAHIDADLYGPTKISLDKVWNKLSRGGAILIDDYNHQSFPGVKKAVEEFGHDFISLDIESGFTKQALIRKSFNKFY